MANFAIKDAMDLKIMVLGEEEPRLVIDYLNDCSFSKTADSVFAKKKGVNAVSFTGAMTGTLTLNSELTSIEALGLALGGRVTGEKIEITDVVPTEFFEIEGTFNTVGEDGVTVARKMTFHKCKPQANCDLSFSAENVASFALNFDLLVDENHKFMTVDKVDATVYSLKK
jgi:hypothetical protein